MQQAIKRIKNANLDHLGTKLQSSQQALTYLQGIIAKNNAPREKSINSLPSKNENQHKQCSQCSTLKNRLNQCYFQLREVKKQMINFNLRDITSEYQRQFQNSFRQLSRFCNTLLQTRQKTISLLLLDIQSESAKYKKIEQQSKLRLQTVVIKKIKQHKQTQTDLHPYYQVDKRNYQVQCKKIELNRCIFSQKRLKSQSVISQKETPLKQITKQVIKSNQQIQPSINLGSSASNSRSKSTITSRRNSIEDQKPLKQKQFMRLAYNNYIQSGKTRQLNMKQLDQRVKPKLKPDFKGKHTLVLTESKPTSISKLNRCRS